jgi:hypothetical protein
MTYTIADQCASLSLQSSDISDFIATTPAQVFSLTLEIVRNCNTNYNFTITMDEMDIPTDSLVITSDMVGGTTALPDGAYYIVLTRTENDGSGITTDKSCIIIDCELRCCIEEHLASNITSNIMDYYLAYTWSTECGYCACDDACVLYNKILDKLDTDGNNVDCGCSG